MLSTAAKAAIVAGTAIVTGAVQISPRDGSPPIRIWGGPSVFPIDGHNYLPVGDRGLVQQTSGAIGGVAQGLVLSLSRVESAALALLDPAEVKDASVIVYRMIFDGTGKRLLDAHVYDRGRGDALDTVDKIGGQAAIKLSVETGARSLGRSGARMRSDSDQRLNAPTDSYFSRCAYAGLKMLYWGGKKPGSLSPFSHLFS